MTTILVCGDRYWTDYAAIRDWMQTLPPGTRIVHGKQRGADLLAAAAAREVGLPIANATEDDPDGGYPYIAKLGLAGGPARNRQMLDAEHPDEVVAWHDDFDLSRGTKNMVEQATRRNIRTTLRYSSVHALALGRELDVLCEGAEQGALL
jgi:hypothetical protein